MTFVAAVCVLAAAKAGGLISVGLLASTPSAVGRGRVWLLVTSGLLVDRPALISVLSFALLAAAVLVVCGPRVFWTAAIAGHVLATLLVYVVIAVVREGDAGLFLGVLRKPDYGVSAVSAAWLAAIATVAWRARARTFLGRAAIVVSCLAVALFAYSLRPELTVLSSEHVVAFALGVAALVAFGVRRPRLAS